MNEELLNKLIEYIDARIRESEPREFGEDDNGSSFGALIELKELVAKKGGSHE